MTGRAAVVLSTVLVVLSACGQTQAAFDELAIAAKAGTLGIGGDLTTDLMPQVNLRAGVQWMAFGLSAELADIDYDLDVDFLNPLVLIDWYPFNGSFRVSGGVLFNGSELHLRATSHQSIEIGDQTFTPAQYGTLKGDVDFRPVAPYIGIGWGNALDPDKRWGIVSDIGIAFTGSPNVDLTATGPDPAVQTQLAQEERDIQDDLDAFKFFPVASISLFFRF
jgi:hypothetical protein